MSKVITWKGYGRKPKNPEDKVISKGVYLTVREWERVEKKYGNGTNAIRKLIEVK